MILYNCEVLQPDFFGEAPYCRYPLAVINDTVLYMQRMPPDKDSLKLAQSIIDQWNRYCRTQYRYNLVLPTEAKP